MFTRHVYLIYKSKQDLALNNLQCLIWHKTKSTYKELFLTFELCTYVKLNCLKWNCFYILLSVKKTVLIYVKKWIWHWVTWNGWYVIKPNQTNQKQAKLIPYILKYAQKQNQFNPFGIKWPTEVDMPLNKTQTQTLFKGCSWHILSLANRALYVCIYVCGSAEKFIGWLRHSHGMWPNDIYFST